MITKNQRTHIIKMRDQNDINITESQYQLYSEEYELKKPSETMKIHDIDTDELLYHGQRSGILGFEKRKTDESLNNANWICSFGIRHPLIGFLKNCECSKEFDCLGITFKYWLRDNGFVINSDCDITEAMRQKYKQANNLIIN